VPWDTLLTSVVLYIVIPVILAQLWRKALLARAGAFDAALENRPLVDSALLATLVLLFAFQGEAILRAAAGHRPAGGADPDPGVLQLRAGLLAEPRGGREAQRRLPVGADRRQQLLRTGGGGRHQPVRLRVRRGAGHRGRRADRGAGDAAGGARGQLLRAMGGEVRIYDPAGLPLPDAEPDSHPKVRELREAAAWAEGMVWTSPERHGAMTGIMKAQIDWIPLELGAVRPTQGKTLAVMQVCGGSQSFNAVNQLRVLGRWMRLLTIPNQSSVAKAFLEFDDAGRMKPSAFYDRVVDVMEELMKFTLLTRDLAPYLVDRYSERKESAQELSRRVNQVSL
jgi:arsenic resistance protein ArsH